MNFTPADDLVDEIWGKVGTPKRDAMEARLEEEVHAYFCRRSYKGRRESRMKKEGGILCSFLFLLL